MDFDAAWTDAVLALTATVAAGVVLARRRPNAVLGAIGVILLGITALLGALRFSVAPSLLPIHRLGVGLTSGLGMPLIGLALLAPLLGDHARRARIVASTALLLPVLFLYQLELYRTALSALGMLLAIAGGAGMLRRAPAAGAAAIGGAVLVVVAGLAISGDGAWAGLSRTGWFHLAMAVAVAAFAVALRHADPEP